MARSIYCSKCKKEKEDGVKNESYCKTCKHERQKLSKMKKRISSGLPATRPIRKLYCDDCILKASLGQDVRGKCKECHRLAQAERVKAKRVAEGLPAESSRQSPVCVKCGKSKTNGRCLPCNNEVKSANKSLKRKLAREESGKRPWGAGRPLSCYVCGNLKENPNASNCNTCSREYSKKHWKEVVAVRANQREVTLICECGKEKKSTRKLYCDDCLHERRLNNNRLHQKRRRQKFKEEGFLFTPEPLSEYEKSIRSAARNYVNCMIKQGHIKRSNCEVCNSDINVEAHHDDYTKPLEIRWLCRTHHAEHHRKLS